MTQNFLFNKTQEFYPMKKILIAVVLCCGLSQWTLAQTSPRTQRNTDKISSTINQPKTTLAEINPSALKYEVGERCEIEHQGKWYGGRIEQVKGADLFYVSWDGYAASYNSDVPKNRLRPMTPIANVPYIVAKRGAGAVLVKGNVKNGKTIDLAWAAYSSNACFPATRFAEFEGNHEFYWLDLPENSEVTITVSSPTGQRINVYGFSGFDGQAIPPNVPSCTSCEAGHEQWNPTNPPTNFTKTAGPQKIQLRAINARFRVLVAVAGAKGVTAGDYELRVEIKPYP